MKFEVCHNFEVLIVITLFLISGAKFGIISNICKKKAIKKQEKYNFNANYWVFLSLYPQIAISSDSKIKADWQQGNETDRVNPQPHFSRIVDNIICITIKISTNMGGRAGGGASGGMGSRSRGGGGTLASRLNSLFGNGVDMEGIGNIALNGEISEFKVDKDTPTVKHVSYKYKGQESPLAHPSIRPSNPNGWHGLTYAKDNEGWYIDDFS